MFQHDLNREDREDDESTLEAQHQAWLRLREQERSLRLVLAWVAHGKAQRRAVAEREAHRPLHITALWDSSRYGFALKLEGYFQGVWLVRLYEDEVVNVHYVDFVCTKPARSILRLTRNKDEDLAPHLLGVVQAFLDERGLVHPTHGAEPSDGELA
jgi:hypothetical protein